MQLEGMSEAVAGTWISQAHLILSARFWCSPTKTAVYFMLLYFATLDDGMMEWWSKKSKIIIEVHGEDKQTLEFKTTWSNK